MTKDTEIQLEYRQQMQAIAKGLDEVFNGDKHGDARNVGFVLLVFPFGTSVYEDRVNYISNGADRKDIVTLMKEMIRRFEGQPEVVGHA